MKFWYGEPLSILVVIRIARWETMALCDRPPHPPMIAADLPNLVVPLVLLGLILLAAVFFSRA
ncbi:MAG: hypothetical protein EA366_11305 [Spirulina sp. DLM2.Bin59]|nr:MAG: hypothetical protein EA366_11305 [Spirulina sp. DLM2.Bin59]